MRDNDIMKILIAELKILLNDNGLSDVKIKQSYQPTQQKTSNDRSIFIHKISNPQVGTGISYNGDIRIQKYLKRASYQFDALAQQDPSDINSLTASDILTTAADLLQSYGGIRVLGKNGVNIERVTDVRQAYFINNNDRNESSPSFDLTVNYEHNYETQTPAIIGTRPNLHGV